MVDSDVGWSWGVKLGVVDSKVGKRWRARVMFDELVVAVGSVVEMGEAKERGTAGVSEDKRAFSKFQNMQYYYVLVTLFKYLLTKFFLPSRMHSNSSSLPSANGSSKSPSASKDLRTSSTDNIF